MNLKNLNLKIEYEDELKNITKLNISVPDYVFFHTKSDLTIEFLQQHNVHYPKISQIFLLYLLYNENETEFKYIINYLFKHLQFNSTDNLLILFQYFTTKFVTDLSEFEQTKINNKLKTYI